MNVDKVFFDTNILVYALEETNDSRHQKTKGFSIWDALIISAAIKAGCAALYTEDLNSGEVVNGVKIVNPFV